VDISTKQKSFSTVDIPSDIRGDVVTTNGEGLEVRWTNDIKGYGSNHTTRLSNDALRYLVLCGNVAPPTAMSPRVLWDDARFRKDVQDITYDSYMQDDTALLAALQQLHTHGLLVLTDVPEAETSVSTIAERIGPLKSTFYGMTWVRVSQPCCGTDCPLTKTFRMYARFLRPRTSHTRQETWASTWICFT